MTKKSFDAALNKTMGQTDTALEARFERADSVLLKPAAMKAAEAAPPAPNAEVSARVVRDTFSMPESDYGIIAQLRMKAAKDGRITTKSELVRAGLQALAVMNPAQLREVLDALVRLKPGRKSI
jgi:hypothetical protein